MKRILLLSIITMMTCYSAAQKRDTVRLRVNYMAEFKEYVEDKKLRTDEMVLDIGHQQSRFYSRWHDFRWHITDSLIARGASFAEVQGAISDYPRGRVFDNIYKHYPQKDRLTLTTFLLKHFYYEEALEKPVWTLIPQDTVILGYRCGYAEGTFRGRKWRACYTEEIPVSEGPWKLGGLPGLILYAAESSGYFSYRCIGLTQVRGAVMPVPKLKKHVRCSRRQLMGMIKEHDKDPRAFERKLGLPGIAFDASGKPLKHPPRTAAFMED
ncbi:GLPGLI family protein [Bacteroides pyogenes]|uniref:GLPGLI family protein n=1 Tax=Bacteroides pyogenes TaxID=310300 RepID=UPI002A90A654|nr:GLPGLI family protein [Bacteroides pyogenes]MDY5434047.1 GLPGLI family protein [Bacteroides pyogenes]